MTGWLIGKSPQQLHEAISGFSRRYHRHWEEWLAVRETDRSALFGRLLRQWQATRPLACRRTQRDGLHPSPFLEDLLRDASIPIGTLGSIDMRSLPNASSEQRHALTDLWGIFSRLTQTENATCVGISKAVMLSTDGRIGPAFDSNVRKRLRMKPARSASAWLGLLDSIAEDIARFEKATGTTLNEAVPQTCRRLGVGRLYDMLVGPREEPAG